MEIEELKTIWQQYDLKLNNLEELNKKLVMQTLSKKPKSRLNLMRFQIIFVLMLLPIVLIIVLSHYFKIENIDWKFIIGCILTLSVVIYLSYYNFKNFMALKKINIGVDTIIETAKKVNEYKETIKNRRKYGWIPLPLIFTGVLLIACNAFTFDFKTILSMAGLFVFALVLWIIKYKNKSEKIEKLEKEILDLKEYEK